MSALCSTRVTDCRPASPVAYSVISWPFDREEIMGSDAAILGMAVDLVSAAGLQWCLTTDRPPGTAAIVLSGGSNEVTSMA